MDRPHVEETRWTCSQEGTGVEPTGEAKEKETPAHLATHENGRVGEETLSRGMRQRARKMRIPLYMHRVMPVEIF